VPGAERIGSTGTPKPSASNSSANTTARANPSSSSTAWAANTERLREQQKQTETTRAVKEDVAKKRDEQCKEASARYQQAVAARRIFKTNEKGERTYLSDAEADQARVAAKSEVDAVCAGAR
jgi:hypothetical protein